MGSSTSAHGYPKVFVTILVIFAFGLLVGAVFAVADRAVRRLVPEPA